MNGQPQGRDVVAGRGDRRRLGRGQPRQSIRLDHSLTERIKLGLNAGFATDDYVGLSHANRIYTLGATAEYHLSR
ncbi:outer membrane beta-barrel protein [Mycobacterium sp. HUMS_1102779]|uniref:outer membrane beta-barrel protein n=1 Tax=Mycobacterium sp. HUMS_1102779 TaxID=3383487 RepID=UPI00389A2252